MVIMYKQYIVIMECVPLCEYGPSAPSRRWKEALVDRGSLEVAAGFWAIYDLLLGRFMY